MTGFYFEWHLFRRYFQKFPESERGGVFFHQIGAVNIIIYQALTLVKSRPLKKEREDRHYSVLICLLIVVISARMIVMLSTIPARLTRMVDSNRTLTGNIKKE